MATYMVLKQSYRLNSVHFTTRSVKRFCRRQQSKYMKSWKLVLRALNT